MAKIEAFKRKAQMGLVGVQPDYGSIGASARTIGDVMQSIANIGVVTQKVAKEAGTLEATQQAEEDVANLPEFPRDPNGNLVPPDLSQLGSYSVYDQQYRKSLLSNYINKIETDIESTLIGYYGKESNWHNPAGFNQEADDYGKTLIETVHPAVRDHVQKRFASIKSGFFKSVVNRTGNRDYRNRISETKSILDKGIADALDLVANTTDTNVNDTINTPEFERANIEWENKLKAANPNLGMDAVNDYRRQRNRIVSRALIFQSFMNLAGESYDDNNEREIAINNFIEDIQVGKGEWRANKKTINGGKYLKGLMGDERDKIISELKKVRTTAIETGRLRQNFYKNKVYAGLSDTLVNDATGQVKSVFDSLSLDELEPFQKFTILNTARGMVRSIQGAKRSDQKWNEYIKDLTRKNNSIKSNLLRAETFIPELDKLMKNATGARLEAYQGIKNFITSNWETGGFGEINEGNADAYNKIVSTALGIASRGVKLKNQEQAKFVLKQAAKTTMELFKKSPVGFYRQMAESVEIKVNQMIKDNGDVISDDDYDTLVMSALKTRLQIRAANLRGLAHERAELARMGDKKITNEKIGQILEKLKILTDSSSVRYKERTQKIEDFQNALKSGEKGQYGGYGNLAKLKSSIEQYIGHNIERDNIYTANAQTAELKAELEGGWKALGLGDDEIQALKNSLTSKSSTSANLNKILKKTNTALKAQIAAQKRWEQKSGQARNAMINRQPSLTHIEGSTVDGVMHEANRAQGNAYDLRGILDPHALANLGTLYTGLPSQYVEILKGVKNVAGAEDPNDSGGANIIQATKLYRLLTSTGFKKYGVENHIRKHPELKHLHSLLKFTTESGVGVVDNKVQNAPMLQQMLNDWGKRTGDIGSGTILDQRMNMIPWKGDEQRTQQAAKARVNETMANFFKDKINGELIVPENISSQVYFGVQVADLQKGIKAAPWPDRFKEAVASRALLLLNQFQNSANDKTANLESALQQAYTDLTTGDEVGSWTMTNSMGPTPGMVYNAKDYQLRLSENAPENHFPVPTMAGDFGVGEDGRREGSSWFVGAVKGIINNLADFSKVGKLDIDFMGGDFAVGKTKSLFLMPAGRNELNKPVYRVGIIGNDGTIEAFELMNRVTGKPLVIDVTNFQAWTNDTIPEADGEPVNLWENEINSYTSQTQKKLLDQAVKLAVKSEIRSHHTYQRTHRNLSVIESNIGLAQNSIPTTSLGGLENWPDADRLFIMSQYFEADDEVGPDGSKLKLNLGRNFPRQVSQTTAQKKAQQALQKRKP